VFLELFTETGIVRVVSPLWESVVVYLPCLISCS